MAEPLRLFILAGEASGDRIGADLVQRLKARGDVSLSGVGGPELEGQGLRSLFPMDDLAVMGWSDVLRRLPLLLWRVRQAARAIIRQRPDVVVLIDSQVFSQQVATRVRRAGLRCPILLYVAPSVWAWRPERAPLLRPLFDEVLAVLPFEPRAMQDLGGPPTHYVGHPALSRFAFRDVQPTRGPLMLLPGSRAGELRRHMGLMRAVVEQLAEHPAVDGFVLPTLAALAPRLEAEVSRWPHPVRVVTGDARQAAFAEAVAAVAVSGTVTLELAMAGLPMVVAYAPDSHQLARYRKLGRPIVIGLPNIVLGRPVVPELVLSDPATASGELIAAVRTLLDDATAIPAQRTAFAELRQLMQKGAPEAPLEDPAERVLHAVQRLLSGS